MTSEGFQELLAVLQRVTAAGQSFEGRIQYELLVGNEFEVDAFIRTNNHLGQGSAIVIPPSDEETT
jgi:hypothetical protein